MEKNETFVDRLRIQLKKLSEEEATLGGSKDSQKRENDIYKKKLCLQKLKESYENDHKLEEPKVFISYTERYGSKIMRKLYSKIKHTKVPGQGRKFDPKHAMDDKGKPKVHDKVESEIRPCFLFLGILTREHLLSTGEGEEEQYAPGAWVLYEAGIAMGMGIPVHFIMEKGVKKEFWSFLPEPIHIEIAFKDHTIDDKDVNRVLGIIENEYTEAFDKNAKKYN